MHPNRRRKKRPNYGIRTVEVARGPNGFGFTISGQQPCILSCIVKDSPADNAGLRAGDFLISVNDVSVSKTTHDSVVNLIGSCKVGPIKMTIAENYYSDSSDEELLNVSRMINSRKIKHKPRPRNHRFEHRNKCNNSVINSSVKPTSHSCVLKYMNNTKGSLNPLNLSNNSEGQGSSSEYKTLVGYLGAVEPPKQLFTSDGRIKGLSLEDQGGPIEYKALVGYLGTIEMPKQLAPDTRLQTVCHCIRKLRQEKRSPTAVLMTVLPTCLTLKNASNHILAIYPTNRVVYIGSAREKDSRYFGLVTSAFCELSPKENLDEYDDSKKSNSEFGISNSCHIFVTDPKLVEHNVHVRKAEAFNIVCSADPISGRCLEFPKDSLYIVSLIQSMYKLQCDVQNNKSNMVGDERNLPVLANSPQPSASSNSDSGIGFRDDFNAISDRIVLVEFPARELDFHINTHPDQSDDILNNGDPSRNTENRFNFDFNKPNEFLKMVLNNEKKPLNNAPNFKAYESVSIKNSLGGVKIENTKNNNENESKLNNFSNIDKLNISNRSFVDRKIERNVSPSSFTSSDDNNAAKTREIYDHDAHEVRADVIDKTERIRERQHDLSVFLARSADFSMVSTTTTDDHVPQQSDHSMVSAGSTTGARDFSMVSTTERSADDLSVCSSRSAGYGDVVSVFKTPSAFFFDRRTRRASKMASSCDDLLDRCVDNKRKFGAKREGTAWSRSNYDDREELSRNDGDYDFGQKNYYYGGSLNDLFLANGGCSKKRKQIARSEPDVRCQNRKDAGFSNDNDLVTSKDGRESSAQEWATSFEKLLEDPEGVKAFAEFLKKEFSSENIDFWMAVERYRRMPSSDERRAEARRIYVRHVGAGAQEAVNVDSHGRQCAERALSSSTNNDKNDEDDNDDGGAHAFDQAQKQVLNLMKFDSYPRFLKSDEYKQCLLNDSSHAKQSVVSSIPTPVKLKKSLSNAEDRRRKSLLPWHRKTRSKSKDRSERNHDACDVANVDENSSNLTGHAKKDMHSSKSSLTSLDLAIANNLQHQKDEAESSFGGPVLCRVNLSNCSTTVVQIKSTETVQELVQRLLEKRGLNYTSYEVYTDKHSKPIDVNEVSTVLAGCEVKIQQRVVFKLDLPNRKTVSVKSKATKMIVDVLKPILHKYDFGVDQVKLIDPKREEGGATVVVDISSPITTIDGLKLQVVLLTANNNGYEKSKDFPVKSENQGGTKTTKNRLVEITNQVFEGILQEKSELSHSKHRSEKGSVKSEDLGSDHSSSYFSKFLRRDSSSNNNNRHRHQEHQQAQQYQRYHNLQNNATTKSKRSLIPRSKLLTLTAAGSSGGIAGAKTTTATAQTPNFDACAVTDRPLIAKWRAGVDKLQVVTSPGSESECNELVEGLTRAQRARLEDQRGTEINFELPDFLKDKEKSGKSRENHDHNPSSKTTLLSPMKTSKNYENQHVRFDSAPSYVKSDSSHVKNDVTDVRKQSDSSYVTDDVTRACVLDNSSSSPVNKQIKLNDNKNDSREFSIKLESSQKDGAGGQKVRRELLRAEPPPLPPKPKIVPMRPPNWGQRGEQGQGGKQHQQQQSGLFLEHSTSSFV